ncbi:alpha/beta fold hydrolase [Chromobacterium alticapitis]|uniref:alpha/beta fold hydrolase n=1 Tax=Chromobacterium alticapitis TaxID=2073169 RepID=UPI0018EDE781|nr:alpha/beta hydrolase [Chromobacterium alticapitis]
MRSLKLPDLDVHLRYHDLPGHGAPLIMLHGLGCASSFDYPRLLAEPGLAGRRALLVDLLGFGFSDKPEDFSYTPGAQARALAQWIEHLDLLEFDLFAHSMGGSIAIELATLMPARIRNLVSAGPNLDSGGGTYSRSLASWSEQDYVATGHHTSFRPRQPRLGRQHGRRLSPGRAPRGEGADSRQPGQLAQAIAGAEHAALHHLRRTLPARPGYGMAAAPRHRYPHRRQCRPFPSLG